MEVALATQRDPATLQPRACDCSFCRKHGAAWLSDHEGELLVAAKSGAALHEYRQGSGNARFLLCGGCGVLVAVVSGDGDDALTGALNATCLDDAPRLGESTVVSPQQLRPDEKIARWQALWTPARIER